jgi:hypothetical protein
VFSWRVFLCGVERYVTLDKICFVSEEVYGHRMLVLEGLILLGWRPQAKVGGRMRLGSRF